MLRGGGEWPEQNVGPWGEDDAKGGGRVGQQDGGRQSAHLRRIGGGRRLRYLHLFLPIAPSKTSSQLRRARE